MSDHARTQSLEIYQGHKIWEHTSLASYRKYTQFPKKGCAIQAYISAYILRPILHFLLTNWSLNKNLKKSACKVHPVRTAASSPCLFSINSLSPAALASRAPLPAVCLYHLQFCMFLVYNISFVSTFVGFSSAFWVSTNNMDCFVI